MSVKIMKFFVIGLILLMGSFSQAGLFLGIGAQTRYLQSENSNWELKFPMSFFSGYESTPWYFLGEGQYYKSQTSSGSILGVRTKHYEASAYVMRLIFAETSRIINPYLIGGVGLYQDRVQITFSGSRQSDSSKLYTTLKAGAGLLADFISHGFCMVEAKAMYSEPYSPDLIFGVDLRLGYRF